MGLSPPSTSSPRESLTLLAAWLQLIRLPRLAIAPAAIVAGYAIGGGGQLHGNYVLLLLLGSASVLLLAGAHLLMAWRHEAQPQRRSMVNGAINPRRVQWVGIAAMALGLLSLGIMANAMLLLIGACVIMLLMLWCRCQHWSWLSALSHGAAHGLCLVLGAAGAGVGQQRSVLVLLSAGVLAIFVVIIDRVRRPRDATPPSAGACRVLRIMPLLLFISAVPGFFAEGWAWAGSWILWGLFTYTTMVMARQLLQLTEPRDIPWYEDALLRNTFFMYALWMAAAGTGIHEVSLMLLLWPASSWLYRLTA